MKGYELIKKIEEGKIKSGTHIIVHTINYELDYWFWGNWFGREDGYSRKEDNIELYLCESDVDFEIVEDIDIQEIEELYIGDVTTEDKLRINELVRAVKQLDKKIKEKQ